MSLLSKLTGCFGNTPQNSLLIFDASLAHIPVWYRSLWRNPFAFDWKCTDWPTSHTVAVGLREWLGCTFERPGKMQSHRSVTPHFQKSPACCNKAYVLQILSDCLFTDHYVILLVVFINKKCLDGRLLSQSRIRQGIYLLHESYLRRQRVQIDHGRCFSPTVSCSRGDLFNSLE